MQKAYAGIMRIKNFIYMKSLLFLCLGALQPIAFGTQGATNAAPNASEAPPAKEGTGLTVAEAAAAVQAVELGSLPAVEPAAAAAAVFAKINPRWHKWEMGIIDDYARKNNWPPLSVDSIRIVPYNKWQNQVGTSFQVNLKTGDVVVFSGQQEASKVRPFKLQAPELEDLKKLLGSKSFSDLATENRGAGLDGTTLFIESDWQGEYRWRLYWGDAPYPLDEISLIVSKAYQRERK